MTVEVPRLDRRTDVRGKDQPLLSARARPAASRSSSASPGGSWTCCVGGWCAITSAVCRSAAGGSGGGGAGLRDRRQGQRTTGEWALLVFALSPAAGTDPASGGARLAGVPARRPVGARLRVVRRFGYIAEGRRVTNADGKTLFDAVARTAVDWDGATRSSCDLSGHVLADLGYFSSRDALCRTHGQTLCLPARVTADLVLGRRAA